MRQFWLPPIAAKTRAAIMPIGYTRSGRAVWPIAGGSMTMQALRGPSKQTAAPGPSMPFVRGSREFAEGPFDDRSVTPGAAAQAVSPIDVPARGWMVDLVLQVEASAGVLGAGVLSEDYPFNVFDQLQLTRPNGDPYFGPLQGYSAFLTNLCGGYNFESDPRASDQFLGGINFRFLLRIPIEITHHDAYGALSNQDAAAAYKLSWTVPASTILFTTAPTTIPLIRFRSHLEGWTQPPPADLSGRPIEQTPPGTPTAQFWSEQTVNVVAGLNTIRLTDVGNLIRTLVFIYRDDTAVRIRRDDELPQDSIRLTYDAQDLEVRTMRGWKDLFYKRSGFALPSGVLAYDKTHDGEGHIGEESRNQYLSTSDATRIEVIGTFTGSGGVLNILTNDVAPAGIQVTP